MSDRRIPKRSTIICAATLITAIFLFVYGRPIALLLLTKWQVRNKPELWIVPTPLPTVAIDSSPRRTFSYLGYEFESPWTDVTLEKKYGSLAAVYFSDGEFICILQGPDLISAMRDEATKRHKIIGVFGAGVMDSNYALRSSILYLTPGDLRLFSSPRVMVANSILLMMKPMSVTTAKSGLYSFQSRWLRGFEEGTPGKANPVKIDAFDEKDREIDIFIGAQVHTNGTVSQADVNRVLFSLHPTAIPPTK